VAASSYLDGLDAAAQPKPATVVTSAQTSTSAIETVTVVGNKQAM
jgi:hypothetical protein